MKKEKKMVVISIDVPEELRDKAKAAAESSDMTMAAWLRQLIRRGATAKLAKQATETEEG
jgi:ribosomal protein L30E